MKRTGIAAIFLIVTLAINIFSAVWTNGVFNELESALESARADISAGDIAGANKKLGDFNEILERNEQGLSLFVRRELVYNIALSGSTLEAYARDEYAEDFCAEVSRTLETVRTVRGSMFAVS